MPGTTTNLALPYPVAADPDNVPGDVLALANRLDSVLGGAWATFTVGLLYGGSAPTAFTQAARLRQVGKTVHWNLRVVVTNAGAVSGPITTSLPANFNAPDATTTGSAGVFWYSSAGGATYAGSVEGTQGSSNCKLKPHGLTAGSPYLSVTAANGDVLEASGTFETP